MGVFLDEVAVTNVVADGVAAKAGLKVGDVFLKVDGKDVGSRADLVRAIQAGGPKKVVGVKRGDEEVELNFAWGAAQ